MRRRLSTILLPAAGLLAVASLSACSGADNNDVAARVNDSELSNDELADLVPIVGTPDPATGTVDPTQGDNVRGAIQLWVQVEVIDAGLEAAGTPITQEQSDAARTQLDGQLPNVEDLSDSTVDTLVTFLALRGVVGAMADQNTFVTQATAAADIHVDPRFGTFDPTAGTVTPLGGVPTASLPTGTAPTNAAPASTAPAG